MTRISLLLMLSLLGQLSSDKQPLDKSAYFAFVDHDFIFTIEIVRPGVPLLNFVSMIDEDRKLFAKNIRFTLENRKTPAKLFSVETGDVKQPMVIAIMTMHPRSSFGVRLSGDFGSAEELLGVTIRVEEEDLRLAPLTNFDFEVLVSKANQINLGSPDFSEDWRVLRLSKLGSRSPARNR